MYIWIRTKVIITMIENIKENIKYYFSSKFTPDDSVVIFDVNIEKTLKYGMLFIAMRISSFFDLQTPIK